MYGYVDGGEKGSRPPIGLGKRFETMVSTTSEREVLVWLLMQYRITNHPYDGIQPKILLQDSKDLRRPEGSDRRREEHARPSRPVWKGCRALTICHPTMHMKPITRDHKAILLTPGCVRLTVYLRRHFTMAKIRSRRDPRLKQNARPLQGTGIECPLRLQLVLWRRTMTVHVTTREIPSPVDLSSILFLVSSHLP